MSSNPFDSHEFRQKLVEFIELQNKHDQAIRDLDRLKVLLSSASCMMELNELSTPHFTVTHKDRTYLFTISYFDLYKEATCVESCEEIETLS